MFKKKKRRRREKSKDRREKRKEEKREKRRKEKREEKRKESVDDGQLYRQFIERSTVAFGKRTAHGSDLRSQKCDVYTRDVEYSANRTRWEIFLFSHGIACCCCVSFLLLV